jgi:hypothetical protein
VRIAALVLLAACTAAPDPADDWGPDASALGWAPGSDATYGPPIADLALRSTAVAGDRAQIEVIAGPPGAEVTLFVSQLGEGDGPCHPSYPDEVCLDLLSPKAVASARTGPDGSARLAVRLPPHAAGTVVFQAALIAADTQGVSSTLPVGITTFDVDWPTFDLLELAIENGESGYDFGMAETGAGPAGWYGEDCFAGTPPYFLCHPVDGAGIALPSVHPEIGGPGLPFVYEAESTLFYDIHGADITVYLRGWDSDACWTFGEDPSYYADAFGCVVL